MDLEKLAHRAQEIASLYDVLNTREGRNVWSREEFVRGFVGDVGTLVRLTMAADGVRVIEGHEEKLEHELADCLWSLLVISEKYGVDLEAAFVRVMDELETKLRSDD